MKKSFKRWPYYLLALLGAAGIIDTLLIAIYSGINAGTLLPGAAGLIIVIYVHIKLQIRKGQPVIRNRTARRVICVLLVLGLLSAAFLEALILYGSSLQEDVEADYLIILGGGLHGGEITLTLQNRLQRGIAYLEKYPDAFVVVSGGKGFGETVTEAEAMERYLISQGIGAGRIIKEDRATSTMENFIYSKKILEDIGAKDISRIVVATSDFHMLRAKMLARRAGFEPYGITSSTPASVRLNCHLREYLALVKSFLFDKLRS